MTIETLQTISFICFLLAAVFFLITIALFFLMNIKKVVGDLSGMTAKRAIENIRNQNEAASQRLSSAGSSAHTSHTSVSTKLRNVNSQGYANTSKLATSKLRREAEETTVLSQTPAAEETTVLSQTVLEETTVLQAPTPETTVLNPVQSQMAAQNKQSVFTIDYEIWFAESTEIIR